MKNKILIRFYRFLLDNFIEINQLIAAIFVVITLPKSWLQITTDVIKHQNILPWITKCLLVAYQVLYMFIVVFISTKIVDIANHLLNIRIYRRWINTFWEYFWLTICNFIFTLVLSYFFGDIPFGRFVAITQIYASYSYFVTNVRDNLPLYLF